MYPLEAGNFIYSWHLPRKGVRNGCQPQILSSSVARSRKEVNHETKTLPNGQYLGTCELNGGPPRARTVDLMIMSQLL